MASAYQAKYFSAEKQCEYIIRLSEDYPLNKGFEMVTSNKTHPNLKNPDYNKDGFKTLYGMFHVLQNKQQTQPEKFALMSEKDFHKTHPNHQASQSTRIYISEDNPSDKQANTYTFRTTKCPENPEQLIVLTDSIAISQKQIEFFQSMSDENKCAYIQRDDLYQTYHRMIKEQLPELQQTPAPNSHSTEVNPSMIADAKAHELFICSRNNNDDQEIER